MAFDWYPFNVNAYRTDTYHLSAAADGIYRRLIDEYMTTGKPLPDHDLALAGIARVTADEWAAHREVLRAFFKAKDGKLYQKRCEQELHAQRMLAAERSKKARVAATQRWIKEKLKQGGICGEHAHSNASAMLGDATRHNTIRTLTTSSVGKRPQTAEKRVADVSRQNLETIYAERKK